MDYSLLGDIFRTTDLGMNGQILPLILIGISAIIITRNARHLGILLFPLALGFNRIGLAIPLGYKLALGVTWIVLLLGPETIGQLASSAASGFAEATKRRITLGKGTWIAGTTRTVQAEREQFIKQAKDDWQKGIEIENAKWKYDNDRERYVYDIPDIVSSKLAQRREQEEKDQLAYMLKKIKLRKNADKKPDPQIQPYMQKIYNPEIKVR